MNKSREEKVAGAIADLLADLRLNLDLVGAYVSRHKPSLGYNRLQEVADSAYYEKNKQAMVEEMPDDIEERFKVYAAE